MTPWPNHALRRTASPSSERWLDVFPGAGFALSAVTRPSLIWFVGPKNSVHPHTHMPKFVIERDIAGAGKLTPEQLQGISQKSCGVLKNLGPQIQWLESYVTDDKVYCVYIAPDEAMVREHAKQGGFPANRVSQIRRVIDPTTAEKT